MLKKILLFIASFLFIAAVAFGAYSLIYKKDLPQLAQITSLSPNILYLTTPVTSFSGNIENIQGNILSISQDLNLPQMPKKITYKVLVNDKTIINQTPNPVPYLFRPILLPVASDSAKLTINDLKKGQFITAVTNTDLRSLNSDQFEATYINLLPKATIINGKITSINKNELIIRGFSPIPPMTTAAAKSQPPTEKDYTVTINQNTEISGNPVSGMTNGQKSIPKPEKYSLSDLKKDLQITVYSEEDTEITTKLTALRIEPFITTQPVSTSSPKLR